MLFTEYAVIINDNIVEYRSNFAGQDCYTTGLYVRQDPAMSTWTRHPAAFPLWLRTKREMLDQNAIGEIEEVEAIAVFCKDSEFVAAHCYINQGLPTSQKIDANAQLLSDHMIRTIRSWYLLDAKYGNELPASFMDVATLMENIFTDRYGIAGTQEIPKVIIEYTDSVLHSVVFPSWLTTLETQDSFDIANDLEKGAIGLNMPPAEDEPDWFSAWFEKYKADYNEIKKNCISAVFAVRSEMNTNTEDWIYHNGVSVLVNQPLEIDDETLDPDIKAIIKECILSGDDSLERILGAIKLPGIYAECKAIAKEISGAKVVVAYDKNYESYTWGVFVPYARADKMKLTWLFEELYGANW